MELQKSNPEKKYTSLYLVEQINLFRSQESNKSVLLHKNLLPKIESEFNEEITELKIQPSSYKDSSGKECKCYELNFEQSLQILMSESKTVRKGVIGVLKAQQEEINELKSQLPDFNNPVIAARAWADEVEAKQLALSQIKELQPKADIADRINSASNLLTMNETAKIINTGRNKLMSELRDRDILMKNNNTPYQQYIDRGYFTVRIDPIKMGEFIVNKPQTLVTAKGLIWLSELFTVNKI